MAQVQELQDAIAALVSSEEAEGALIQQVIDRLNEADEDFTDEITALTAFATGRAERLTALQTAFDADAAPPTPGGGTPV